MQSQPDSSHFNPRSPCGERPLPVIGAPHFPQFQSTLPVRGATSIILPAPFLCCISIHAPRAGSDSVYSPQIHGLGISIHAPRAGSDDVYYGAEKDIVISIHAPRAGSDEGTGRNTCAPLDFNPRSPCGERQLRCMYNALLAQFQSTLPVRGATSGGAYALPHFYYFNPRSPCGERQYLKSIYPDWDEFQSTLPVRGATAVQVMFYMPLPISIHAPRAGSDSRSMLAIAKG